MTVSSQKTIKSANGDGSNVTFPYDFKIFADADLTVILRSAAGTETVQTLTTHYSVTNAGVDSGGNVVFETAPASGVTVVIRRNIAQTQTTDYTANDPFPAESHEDALDRLTFIAQQQQEELDRAIKLSRTNTMTSTEFTVGASERANKILAFDSSGEISVTQELGTYQGTDATITTEAYVARDIVKSTTTAQLNNVYICVAVSVVGDLLTDTDHFELLVDAVSAAASAATATTQAGEASTSAGTATTKADEAAASASTASTKATLAENYAVKVDGAVESGKYSSKAWAIGGTDITDTAGAGSAKSWAVEADAVDGTEFSAKVYAGSGSTLDVGSAKNWALGGGDSFATSTTVGTTGLYSAKYWAEQSALSKTEFSNIYHGSSATDPTGGTVTAGDLYFNSGSSVLKFYTGSAWNTVEAVDTSELASNGFAVAMAIAL